MSALQAAQLVTLPAVFMERLHVANLPYPVRVHLTQLFILHQQVFSQNTPILFLHDPLLYRGVWSVWLGIFTQIALFSFSLSSQ